MFKPSQNCFEIISPRKCIRFRNTLQITGMEKYETSQLPWWGKINDGWLADGLIDAQGNYVCVLPHAQVPHRASMQEQRMSEHWAETEWTATCRVLGCQWIRQGKVFLLSEHLAKKAWWRGGKAQRISMVGMRGVVSFTLWSLYSREGPRKRLDRNLGSNGCGANIKSPAASCHTSVCPVTEPSRHTVCVVIRIVYWRVIIWRYAAWSVWRLYVQFSYAVLLWSVK